MGETVQEMTKEEKEKSVALLQDSVAMLSVLAVATVESDIALDQDVATTLLSAVSGMAAANVEIFSSTTLTAPTEDAEIADSTEGAEAREHEREREREAAENLSTIIFETASSVADSLGKGIDIGKEVTIETSDGLKVSVAKQSDAVVAKSGFQDKAGRYSVPPLSDLFAASRQDSSESASGCVEASLHRMQWAKNPFAWANRGESGSSLAVSDESVLTMQVRACQEPVVVKDLEEPVVLVLSTGSYDGSKHIPQARFWDPSLSAWSDVGLKTAKVDAETGNVNMTSPHLTDFAVVFIEVLEILVGCADVQMFELRKVRAIMEGRFWLRTEAWVLAWLVATCFGVVFLGSTLDSKPPRHFA